MKPYSPSQPHLRKTSSTRYNARIESARLISAQPSLRNSWASNESSDKNWVVWNRRKAELFRRLKYNHVTFNFFSNSAILDLLHQSMIQFNWQDMIFLITRFIPLNLAFYMP